MLLTNFLTSGIGTSTVSVRTSGVANYNLVGQIYCTFPMGKPMIVCNSVLTVND